MKHSPLLRNSAREPLADYIHACVAAGLIVLPVPRPILIIDDNPDHVDLLCRALRRAGSLYPVQSFLNGEDVIAHLTELSTGDEVAEWLPILCVVDVKMPGFGGAEVLQWIRNHAVFDSMAVMMCSSSVDPKDLQEARRYGAQCYAQKHPDSEHFKQIIACAERYADDLNAAFDVPCNLLVVASSDGLT